MRGAIGALVPNTRRAYSLARFSCSDSVKALGEGLVCFSIDLNQLVADLNADAKSAELHICSKRMPCTIITECAGLRCGCKVYNLPPPFPQPSTSCPSLWAVVDHALRVAKGRPRPAANMLLPHAVAPAWARRRQHVRPRHRRKQRWHLRWGGWQLCKRLCACLLLLAHAAGPAFARERVHAQPPR